MVGGLMYCICSHDEKFHKEPSPYMCVSEGCDCEHFRWEWLDWLSPQLRELQREKAVA